MSLWIDCSSILYEQKSESMKQKWMRVKKTAISYSFPKPKSIWNKWFFSLSKFLVTNRATRNTWATSEKRTWHTGLQRTSDRKYYTKNSLHKCCFWHVSIRHIENSGQHQKKSDQFRYHGVTEMHFGEIFRFRRNKIRNIFLEKMEIRIWM